MGTLRRLAGGPRLIMANMRDKPEDYAELERLIAAGDVTPLIEQRFPLERGIEAAERGGVRGKVIIEVARS